MKVQSKIMVSALFMGVLAACTTAEIAPESYSWVEVDHGMTVQEQRQYRLSQVEEMQVFVGEIVEGRNLAHDAPYRTETFDIHIENLGQVEHTIWLDQDQGIAYSWEILGESANGGVYYDHHGHPGKENRDEFAPGFFETFATGIAPAAHGLVNPGISGYHGWFFINLEERPITVRVTISGYWGRHLEIYRVVAGEVITQVDY